ncbi:hypothetical protein [Archangium sp.]|uniref:hypothetical protein n=1 Tax=Archangium sp. TaxID=1872627 RepID=UPI00389A8594
MRKRVLAIATLLVLVAGVLFLTRGSSTPVAAEDSRPAPGEKASTPSPVASAGGPSQTPQTGRVVIPPSESKTPSERVFFQGSWGSGEEQFGRLKANESNPEAPMSIAADRQGNVYVLDQVNGRISRFDKSGKVLPPIPVTQQVPRDLEISSTGTLLVMDNLRDNTVAVLDPDGKPLGELPVPGKNLEKGGQAVGVFADSSGVYVERGQGMAVRVGDAAGNIDPQRPLLDGRPSRDGASLLSMAVIQMPAGRFWVRSLERATGQMKFMREYVLPTPIVRLSLLDSDATGRIYVAAHVAREQFDPATKAGQWMEESVQLLCLSPMGEVQKVLSLPPNTLADESVRDLTVRDDGLVLYMHRTQEGVQLLQYSCG